MLQFVQQVFHDTWKVKDDIRVATEIDAIEPIVKSYRDKYGV